jgi:CTP:molybdopterin cytidylyltransferase MocA
LQAAAIRDGLVSHVTVTDPHHALCGQLLSLVSLHSARGPAYIVVALPDGRHRSLRRALTELAGAAAASVASLCDGPRVSVGTLLPLARHIVARLVIAVEEVTHDDRAPPVAELAPLCAAGVTAVAALAEPAERDANADRPASRRAAAPDGAEGRLDEGDVRC